MRAEKLDGRRGGGEGGRDGGDGGPHYKFNLTNGSENLETMEYMKCGRVYHDGRHGLVPAAILSWPIHILRERARGWEEGGGRRWNIERRAIGKAKHTPLARQEVARHTHGSCLARSNYHVYPFDSATTWIFQIYSGIEIRREQFIAPFETIFHRRESSSLSLEPSIRSKYHSSVPSRKICIRILGAKVFKY